MGQDAFRLGLAASFLLWLALLGCEGDGGDERPPVSVGEWRDAGVRAPDPFRPSAGPTVGAAAGSTPPADEGSELSPELHCGESSEPVDVILIVDTSASMQQEIVAIQDNLDNNFAQILEAEGVDYRVILLADYGESDPAALRICISPPLAAAGCSPLPAAPQNGERFFHYATVVSSHDSWCRVLDSYALADRFLLAPGGFRDWLRPGALTVFVVVSDDTVNCASDSAGAAFTGEADPAQAALDFDGALIALDALQFERGAERTYKWYSIVGLSAEAAPDAPLQDELCTTAQAAGLPYQALSRLTQAGRYPVCEGRSFGRAFRAIAAEVVDYALCQP